MKKRILSLVLMVCVVVTLFTGFSPMAKAADDTIEYTLKSGDNVFNVCTKLGVDFYANYDWITKTNNITNYSKLAVGRVIILPAAGTKPTYVAPGTDTGSTNTGGTNTGSTNTGATGVTGGGVASGSLLEGDFISGYLFSHVIQSGENVLGICNALGVDFYANDAQIKKLNNITSYNSIPVGRNILIPSAKAPTSGSCIKIVAHKVVSGDTALGLCSSYGIDYYSNLILLNSLNSGTTLPNIKTGQILYIPVPTVMSSGSTGGNNNGSGNGSTPSPSPSPSPSASPSPSPVIPDGEYAITTAKAENGQLIFTVNGRTAASAAGGKTVKVIPTPDDGYEIDKITVNKEGTTTLKAENGYSFVMPNHDVTITAIFKAKIYTITSDTSSTTNGEFEMLVDDKAVTETGFEKTVTVKTTPEAGYEVDKISIVNADGKTVATANADGEFTMPNCDITVQVTFKKAGLAINKSETTNGSFDAVLNGTTDPITSANVGDMITVQVKADEGFCLDELFVTTADEKALVVDANNQFTMPGEAVTIKVTFKPNPQDLKWNAAEGKGSFELLVEGAALEGVDYSAEGSYKAARGQKVAVKTTASTGYVLKSITVTYGDVEVPVTNGEFTMPDHPVRVKVTFEKATYGITAKTATNGSYKVTREGKTAELKEAVFNNTIVVTPTAAAGYVLDKISVTTLDENGKTVNVTVDSTKNSFVMPAGAVTITVTFKKI